MPPDEAVAGTESRASYYLSLRSRRSNRHLADASKQSVPRGEPPMPQYIPAPTQQTQQTQPPQHSLATKSSRRSLRHIFSRSKLRAEQPSQPSSQSDAPPVPAVTTELRNASTLDIPLPPEPVDKIRSSSIRSSSIPRARSLHRQSSAYMNSRKGSIQDMSADSLAAWEMPQLFKAFPQTIRQATLPAVTMPTEMVLRLHEKGVAAAALELPNTEESTPAEKAKKKHSKNPSLSNLQWTTKIYLLVTSGYLLQYSGAGHYDRLPEKVLKLTSTSAAFVTDSIPGRHWVLQVSSTTEPDAAIPTNESKSILSKLSIMGGDKRDTPNVLMVFESPGDLDSWMVTLRGEIEKLGGRRKMSETGLPERTVIPRQPSRNMVIRDSARFSYVTSRSPSRLRKESHDDGDVTLKPSDFQHSREQSLDDSSTTNSVVSQDARQLDNLRDSNGNRLSFASADRRTALTSAASSPERSPIAENFPRSSIETCDSHEYANGVKNADTKPRPNASVIASRRSTMSSAGLFIDINTIKPDTRNSDDPFSSNPNESQESPSGPITPNFSVPQSSSRRYSYIRANSSSSQSPPSPNVGSFQSRLIRTKPPPVAGSSRPLSMVIHQQSPRTDVPARPPTADGTSYQPLSPVKELRQHSPDNSADGRSEMISPRSSVAGRESMPSPSPSSRTSPRRSSKPPVAGLRRSSPDAGARGARVSRRLSAMPRDVSSVPVFTGSDDASHRKPTAESSRVKSVAPSREGRRMSVNTAFAELAHRRYSSSDEKCPVSVLPPMPPPPSGPLPSLPSNASTPKSEKQKALSNRRSMPQMMPPRVPPPLRELPPIPPISSVRV